jgi:anti-sigma factor RsiW
MTDATHDELGPEARPEEIAALVDGLLAPARAQQIRAQAARSPDLAEAIEAQETAVGALRGAAAEAARDGAPAALRARVESARRPADRPRSPRRALLGGAAFAAVIVAVLAAFLLPAGGGGPSVAAAAELGARPADAPAPTALAATPALLDASVDGVAFPAWDEEFGWRATGQRQDDLDGRDTRTVVYEKDGARVAYTIVSGDALDDPDDAREVTRDGVELREFTSDGRPAVTWLRDGHTCVLSGEGVDEDTLTKLAVWKGAGAVTF